MISESAVQLKGSVVGSKWRDGAKYETTVEEEEGLPGWLTSAVSPHLNVPQTKWFEII